MDWIWERNYRSEMEDIIRYSRLLYDKNLVSAAGGNVSERCGSEMLITASNAPLREITPDSLVLCDLKGAVIEKNQHLRPSKETLFHAGRTGRKISVSRFPRTRAPTPFRSVTRSPQWSMI